MGGGGTTFDASDRELLVEFLVDLREVMGDVIDKDVLPDELSARYRQVLGGLTVEFESVITQLRERAIDEDLRAAGLLGVPLRLKLDVYRAGRALMDWTSGLATRAAAVTLKAADVILGSLTFIPGVEPIKELKESLEVGIEVAKLRNGAGGSE